MNPQRWKLRDCLDPSLKLYKTDNKTTKAYAKAYTKGGASFNEVSHRRHCAFMALTSFAYNELDAAVAD